MSAEAPDTGSIRTPEQILNARRDILNIVTEAAIEDAFGARTITPEEFGAIQQERQEHERDYARMNEETLNKGPQLVS